MKIVTIITLALCASGLMSSCEKDNIRIDPTTISVSVDAKEEALVNALGGAPEGWVMMVKATASDSAYIPIVMKFDTLSNIVKMRSPFGTQQRDTSTFLISRSASGVVLNFSGGSIISALMRQGPTLSNITDYQFNVLGANMDTITIQGIRSGGAQKPEGGAIFKLFRKPPSWTWADEELQFDLKLATNKWFMGRYARIDIQYLTTNEHLNMRVIFFNSFDPNLDSWQRFRDPFYVDGSARVFDPFYLYDMNILEDNPPNSPPNRWEYHLPIQGHNSMLFRPFEGNSFTVANGAFNTNYKFNYLVFNNVKKANNGLTMDVAAYDKYGKEYIQGTFTMAR